MNQVKQNQSVSQKPEITYSQILNDAATAVVPVMMKLAERWVDESRYEDINDYAAPIQKVLPHGLTILNMTKRPFGFTFRLGDYVVTNEVKLTRTSGKFTQSYIKAVL